VSRLVALLLLLAPLARGQAIGETVPELAFKDIRFASRTLADFGEQRAFVLAFVTRECPIARRYLPTLARLDLAWRSRGVQVVVVDVGRGDTIVEMAAFALEHDLAAPIVKDTDLACVRACGVTRTPEVVVLDAARTLRYRGRIDDQVRAGGAREAPTRRDLEEALEEVLAGRPVSVAETPVDGCRITLDAAAPAQVDFAAVAPLVERHCLDCHRPGGSAPFSLATYAQVRRHGEMIAEVVAEGRMPPWYATGGADAFANHRGLSPDERRAIVDWVRSGMARGDVADAPPPAPAPAWEIGEPDVVLRMPKPIEVMAEGFMPYQYVVLPHAFERDTWVQRLEVAAEADPEVLHHCNVFYLLPGRRFDESQVIAGKVPGGAPLLLKDGVAVLIPKGALLGLQIHYQPIGVALESTLEVGLSFPRARVRQRLRGAVIQDPALAIPPGEPHHRLEAGHTFEQDVLVGGFFGHMHVRGKDFIFSATHPDGRRETLVEVPSYSFDWQMSYELREPRRFAAGTRIDCVAHFDNSRFNPYNPDPTRTVRFGLQTTQEMLYSFVFYVLADEDLDLDVDPATGWPR
jgi:mono/diheme cytochrome c family protein